MLSSLENLQAPPAAVELEAHELAIWEAKFQRDKQVWGELLLENIERLERGSYSLHWTNTDGGGWGTRRRPSSRALPYTDINRPKHYGTIPDRSEHRDLCPRGSIRSDSARTPVI